MPLSNGRAKSQCGPREKIEYRRLEPGVLAFNRQGEALYMNQRGADLLERIGMMPGFFTNGGRRLRQIILDLLVQLDRRTPAGLEEDSEGEEAVSRVWIKEGAGCLFRALRLRCRERHDSGRFLVLIEEVSEAVRSDRPTSSVESAERERKVAELFSDRAPRRRRAIRQG